MGVHIIEVKLPTDHIADADVPKLYEEHSVPIATAADRVKHVVRSTSNGRRIVIFSGGAKKDDAAL